MKEEGNFILPAASAEFVDSKRCSDTVRTKKFMLNVGDVPAQKTDKYDNLDDGTQHNTGTSDSNITKQNQTEKSIFEQI